MSSINNLGNESSPIWILLDAPYENDSDDGVILSSGYGYNFKKIWKLAGMDLNNCFIRSLRPCLGATYIRENVLHNLLADLDKYHPTIIVPLSDEILNYLVPETTQAKEKNSSLGKWAGSLLTSKYLSYPHYVIGSYPPDYVTRNWDYNEIQAFIDFGHVKEEFDYWRHNGCLNPLLKRNLIGRNRKAFTIKLILVIHILLPLPKIQQMQLVLVYGTIQKNRVLGYGDC